ncbi:L-alanine-DL-glutamate epimerase-like enolase superfamily enzyme [Nocardioides panaciterrulae]|uniref:L-alanine-DL-glutamate epimerase-like enolase superfamily enzyme n=1 Tax=Nocardioides panaciterrulae TaxID=661492 RepID=A0A7Y9E429_9ACTN|nr:L-alanine-DL-glutamate epimerase-like enolase superfamily enzyme [Nocardioides panaciterrulae]
MLVQAEAGGRTGLGWTYAPAAAAQVVDGLLADVVTGRDALAPESANDAMVRAVRNAGRPGLVAMAISAVDIALWDLAARLQDVPLHRLWGVDPDPVEVYGSGGFTTYDDDRLRTQVEGWCELGLRRVKIKIGESWGSRVDRDLERAALARKVAGDPRDDGADLFVDANGGYSAGEAIRVGRALEDLGVVWFEEPVTSDDLPGLARVRDGVTADVTAGEYGYDLTYFQRMAPSVDCLQVDVTRCGGYTEWRRIAAAAHAQHVPLSGHCAPYVSLPVAAASPGLRHLEWFHDHVRIEQRLFDGCPDPIDAHLTPSDAPGHGLTLKQPR